MDRTDDAQRLEDTIAALTPDRLDEAALRGAIEIATRLESTTAGALASAIARTLAGCIDGVVEPHNAQWRLASAALTLRQELIRAGGPSGVAVAGAIHELEMLFPRKPESPTPPTAEDLDIVHPARLVRRE
jgi:hypothetical protein